MGMDKSGQVITGMQNSAARSTHGLNPFPPNKARETREAAMNAFVVLEVFSTGHIEVAKGTTNAHHCIERLTLATFLITEVFGTTWIKECQTKTTPNTRPKTTPNTR